MAWLQQRNTVPQTLPIIAANGNALAKYLASRGVFARTLPKDIGGQGACQNFARKFSFFEVVCQRFAIISESDDY